MTRNIDELSNLTTRAVEPEKYFGEMDLNEEQVDRRLKYTKKANELFDVILILLMTMRDNGTLDYVYARDMLESWLLSLIAEFTTPDDYLIDYATDTAYNFIDTTKNHIDEPWYTSSDRSLFNAENSANDVMNYYEYIDALHSGKTHKKWITEKDNRVRKTHKGLDEKTIGITEVFHVGFALMRFPKDYDLAEAFPEELINCRCSIKYLPQTLNELNQHKKGDKVYITDQAINKVGREAPSNYSEEEIDKTREMHKEILRVSQTSNNSNEVAMAMVDGKVGTPVLGDQKSVDIYSNSEMYHTLRGNDAKYQSVHLAHNHPGLSYFSMDDILIFIENVSIKTISIVTNQGKVRYLTKTSNYFGKDEEVLNIFNTIAKKDSKNKVEEFLKSIYNMVERN